MKAIALVICMGWFLQGFGQQNYFVLIQSEKSQPFYARVLDRNYSSSAIGHLIISNLKDSAYTVVIGFPQNAFPEQEFLIRISKKDRGYQLKNLGDKGWALFDTRSLELISPVKAERGASGGTAVYIRKTDAFAKLMAGVVNDTAVMYAMVEEKPKQAELVVKKEDVKKEAGKEEPAVAVTPVEKKPEPDSVKKVEMVVPPTQETVVASAKADTVSKDAGLAEKKTGTEPVKEVVVQEVEQEPLPPMVKIISQKATDTGYFMVMVDDLKDTIGIFIPSEKEGVKQVVPQIKQGDGNLADEPVKKSQDESVKKQEPVIKDTVAAKNAPAVEKAVVVMDNKMDEENARADSSKKAKLVMINSDCRNFAAANDVDKLRVKLMQEKDAASRISAAKKIFRTKCFNAQQVKGLTELFPYEDQKYLFLEAAYPFVSDTGNFKELVSLFADPVYNQRFRKLVRLD